MKLSDGRPPASGAAAGSISLSKQGQQNTGEKQAFNKEIKTKKGDGRKSRSQPYKHDKMTTVCG